MGRPRKRRRDPEADVHSRDHRVDTLPESASAEITLATSLPLPQDLVFNSQLGNGSSNPLNGSSNDLFDGGLVSYSIEPHPPIQANQWDLSQDQDDSSAWQTTQPLDFDPMGLMLEPSGSLESHITSGSDGNCSCLAALYSTLSSFQSLPPSSFPFSMGALTKATKVARDACRCKQCPTQYATALQNLMLLSTLLPLIAHEYGKLLEQVDERASKGGSVTLRMGERDASIEDMQRHTFDLDCPMAFDMELSAREWMSMARKAISKKVIGPDDASVLGVVNDLESRQKYWHEHPTLAEFQHGKACKEHGPEVGEEHTCLQMLNRVKSAVRSLELE